MPAAGALPQTPGFTALVPISEIKRRGRLMVTPISDLGPWDGARVVSQQSPILRPGQVNCSSTNRRRHHRPRFGQVVRSDPPRWIEIPPVWANSPTSLDAVAEPRFRQRHDAVIGVAPSGGIRTRHISICYDQAEPLTDAVSGTLRRNGLGAIAL